MVGGCGQGEGGWRIFRGMDVMLIFCRFILMMWRARSDCATLTSVCRIWCFGVRYVLIWKGWLHRSCAREEYDLGYVSSFGDSNIIQSGVRDKLIHRWKMMSTRRIAASDRLSLVYIELESLAKDPDRLPRYTLAMGTINKYLDKSGEAMQGVSIR